MRNKEDSSSSFLKLYLILIKILVRLVRLDRMDKAYMYNQLKTMIKVPQIAMDILKKKWKVADLEEWFHLAFWAWNGLMLGHPEIALLEMDTQRNTRLTSFVALLLFVAATPA